MAEQIKLELTGITSYGDDVSRTTTSTKATNVFLDEAGYLRQRGGLNIIETTGVSLPTQKVDGMFYWQSKNLVMIVIGGSLYEMNDSNVISLVGSGLETGTRASFAIARTSTGVEALVVANGGDMYIYDPINVTWNNVFTGDNDAPRNVKKIVFLDSYIIALPTNSNKFYFSDVGNPESWSALSFNEAEARADNIENIIVKGFYIYIFGEQTVEIYYNDGVTPFVRLDGGLIETGTIAPFSVSIVEDKIYFLDSNRRIATLEGSTYNIVSTGIDRFLQSLDLVTDAYSYPIIHAGRVFYAITFPSADRTAWDGSTQTGITFVLDVKNGQFFEWALWNSGSSEYGPFPIFSQAYAGRRRRQFLGRESLGQIFELDLDVYQDNGGTLRSVWESGHLDFGTFNKKRINKMRWRMTSGDNSSVDTNIVFNYRVDGQSDYDATREQSLTTGSSSLNQFHANINNLRIARSYQFKMVESTNSPLCIGDITLIVDIMTN